MSGITPTAATFEAIPVAVFGIVHDPFVPHTANVTVSAKPNGVPRVPCKLPARVSTKRHGTIGTNDDDTVAPPDAFADCTNPTAVSIERMTNNPTRN